MWRRDGDSNPGYPLGVRQFSKLLLSATQAPLQKKKEDFRPPLSGGSGIRTPVRLSPKTVFKTVAFDRSAKPPFNTTNIYQPS